MVQTSDMNIPLSSYTDISNSDFDVVMSKLVSRFPKNEIVMTWGHLKSINGKMLLNLS